MKKTGIGNHFLASLVIVAITACASGGHHKTHWSYKGNEGPEHWADLSKDYHLCKDGKQQSPINISGATRTNLPAIEIDYKATAKGFVNNGHTVQVNMNEGSSITVAGKRYKLLQFHFHAPSEHTLNGKPLDMVAHFVHQAEDGQLGVIGVLFKEGRENGTLAKLWEHLPKNSGDDNDLSDVKIDVAKLLPHKKGYFNYAGSLTTPPCSEGVNWMLLKYTENASADQIKAFKEMFPVSVRPVQPLHGRVVKSSR